MMEMVHAEITRYLEDLHPSNDPILKEMERLAGRLNFPIVGPLVGRLLYQLARMTRASTVFEMGSGFGYSAYWFARALPPSGYIYHTDTSTEHSRQAHDFLRRGHLLNKVRFLVGNALELVEQTRGHFDIIFIDIEKEDYPKAYEKARHRIRPGGLLVADNALWSGRVTQKKGDAATEGIKKFNRLLAADTDFFQVIIPLRDGVSVNLKIK